MRWLRRWRRWRSRERRLRCNAAAAASMGDGGQMGMRDKGIPEGWGVANMQEHTLR